jgi:hypothetical protein
LLNAYVDEYMGGEWFGGSGDGVTVRTPDDLFSFPRCTKDQALAVERKRDADMVAAEQAISAIYSVKKPETTWAADFRVAQALLESGNVRWGYASRR